MRARIWKAHIPAAAKISKDVDFEKLALKYELSGGFIKNAVLSALSSAVSRNHGFSLSLSLSHFSLISLSFFLFIRSLMSFKLNH
jgi:hypothetical protein